MTAYAAAMRLREEREEIIERGEAIRFHEFKCFVVKEVREVAVSRRRLFQMDGSRVHVHFDLLHGQQRTTKLSP